MSHYVMVDGVLTLSTPETAKWARRAAKTVPGNAEKPDAVSLPEDKRTDWEILESLEETDEPETD